MLISLTVKNFAIIDNINIDFEDGMSVLTGETGAGKSLIVDAISLLFGARASNNLVRHDENKAIIEGVFANLSNEVYELLEQKSIDINKEEDILVIKREIFQNGKSVAKVNHEVCNLSLLEDLQLYLGDIHTQFDTIKLVNPKNYFSFIDDANINNLLDSYKINLKEYRKVFNQYLEKVNEEKENTSRVEFLKYQKQELMKASLSVDEEKALIDEIKVFANYEKISSNYQEFKDSLDDEVIDRIYEAIQTLKKNQEYDSSIGEITTRLENDYYDLVDIHDQIIEKFRRLDFDPSLLEEKNERLSIYSFLKRKYKLQTDELIEYLQKISLEIENIENYDFYLEELKKSKDILFNKVFSLGKEISKLRKVNASVLENELIKIFPELQLNNTIFKILFKDVVMDDNIFKSNGIDTIDFLISFNVGEPLQPLAKVASGGELSRFMLAIKSVIAKRDLKKTFLFDEIDSGISGEIAFCIAKKMKEISLNNQVICVTHLPQVASIADRQYYITKKIIDEAKTVTQINLLEYDRRVEIIASMISKNNLTQASITLAKEFLNNNE